MDEQTKPLPPESEPVTPQAAEQKALEVRPPRRHTPTALPPSANKRKVGKGQRPPHRGAKTPKNSYTSPRAIVSARKRNEAVQLREQGYSLAAIAKHLGSRESTVHAWIVEALRAIPMESAQEVLRMELRRLDSLLSAFIGNGIEGDLPAADMSLKIIEKRARLLGLYPEMGKPSPVGIAVQVGGGEVTEVAMQIEFVPPTHRDDDELGPPVRDVSPNRADESGNGDQQSRIEPAPRRDYPTVPDAGPIIDARANPPTSVPITGKRRGFDWS